MRKHLIKNFKSILVAGRDVFETALVDSIITIITTQEHSTIDYLNMDNETKKICFIRSVDKSVLDAPYALDIIFSNSIDTIAKLEKSFTTLGHYYKCENACATSDCYKLKEILYSLDCEEDFSEATHYKVINTGTIGRYKSRWGKQPMKYLKDKYQFPVVDKTAFHELFPNSYGGKAEKKKIIIKGLTLLDGCIDFEGMIIPGKSTMMIECNGYEDILFLCGMVNSKLMIYFIKQKYSSSSYNGGINFSKEMIDSLPWTMDGKDDIVSFVKQIIALDPETDGEQIAELDWLINAKVYEIFSLSQDEIKMIEETI